MEKEIFRLSRTEYFLLETEIDTSRLTAFDFGKIYYCENSGDKKIMVKGNDNVLDSLTTIKNSIKSAKNLDPNLKKGMVGYYWNLYSNLLMENQVLDIENITPQYWLWSNPSEIGIESWMYRVKGEVYLEIAPVYKYHYMEVNHRLDGLESFEKFMTQYHVILLKKLHPEILESWYNESQVLIEGINKNTEKLKNS